MFLGIGTLLGRLNQSILVQNPTFKPHNGAEDSSLQDTTTNAEMKPLSPPPLLELPKVQRLALILDNLLFTTVINYIELKVTTVFTHTVFILYCLTCTLHLSAKCKHKSLILLFFAAWSKHGCVCACSLPSWLLRATAMAGPA